MDVPPDSVTKKTTITENQRKILISLFNKGMCSKSIKMAHKHEEACTLTGLSVNVVLDWIGNYQRKKNGRVTNYPKTHVRKMSSYNIFVKENKESFSNMAEWGAGWKQLDEKEKGEYKAKAESFKPENHPERETKFLLCRLSENLQNLQTRGVDMVCIGRHTSGEVLLYGTGSTANAVKGNASIMSQIFAAQNDKTPQDKEDIDTLRKHCREHLNKLYSSAIGKKSRCFPYRNVILGRMVVQGLPEECTPMKQIYSYGKKTLKKILDVQEISVIETTCQPNADAASSMLVTASPANVKEPPDNDKFEDNELPELTLENYNILKDVIQTEETPDAELSVPSVIDLDVIQTEETPDAELSVPSVIDLEENMNSQKTEKAKNKQRKRKIKVAGKKTLCKKKKTTQSGEKNGKTFLVEDILSKRIRHGKEEFLVQWVGYENPTWEPEENFANDVLKNIKENKKL